ncbi:MULTISPECIES: LPS translocon maturation chaperone LptM [Leeia]
MRLRLLLLALSCTALVACGIKGPLYLPQDPASQAASAPR